MQNMVSEKICNKGFYYSYQDSGKISYEDGSATEVAFIKRGNENKKEDRILLFQGKEAGYWVYLEIADIFFLEFNGRGMRINQESCNLRRHILYKVTKNNYRLAMKDEHEQIHGCCDLDQWWHPKSMMHKSEQMELCLIGVHK